MSVFSLILNKLVFILLFYLDIIFYLFQNRQYSTTYACAGGYVDVVKVLLESGAGIEDHNENGHTPLMEARKCWTCGSSQIAARKWGWH